jgi:hypothetical protein
MRASQFEAAAVAGQRAPSAEPRADVEQLFVRVEQRADVFPWLERADKQDAASDGTFG